MGHLIFKNNAQSSLSGGIGITATQILLQAGTGALFAQPVPGSGDYFVGTLIDAATGLINEIVNVIGRSGDTLTVERGRESTEAKSWLPNDLFAELWTAGQAGTMLQNGDEQGGLSSFGVDTGIANAYSATLNPALVTNLPGQAFRIKILNSNTGASTVNFGVGAVPIRNAQGLALSGGELVAGYVYEMYWNGATYNLPMPSLVSIPTGMITPYAGGSVPGGWLACNGQSVSKDVYGSLFTVISTVYGGTGTPMFNVPDLNGRVPAMLDGGKNRLTTNTVIGPNTLAGYGGVDTVTLAEAQMPAHTHALNEGSGHGHGYSEGSGHDHQVDFPEGAFSNHGAGGYLPSGTLGGYSPSVTSGKRSVGITISSNTTGATIGSKGSGGSHSNLQPTLIVNYMIKT
jgi:microcystin-dependent protein